MKALAFLFLFALAARADEGGLSFQNLSSPARPFFTEEGRQISSALELGLEPERLRPYYRNLVRRWEGHRPGIDLRLVVDLNLEAAELWQELLKNCEPEPEKLRRELGDDHRRDLCRTDQARDEAEAKLRQFKQRVRSFFETTAIESPAALAGRQARLLDMHPLFLEAFLEDLVLQETLFPDGGVEAAPFLREHAENDPALRKEFSRLAGRLHFLASYGGDGSCARLGLWPERADAVLRGLGAAYLFLWRVEGSPEHYMDERSRCLSEVYSISESLGRALNITDKSWWVPDWGVRNMYRRLGRVDGLTTVRGPR